MQAVVGARSGGSAESGDAGAGRGCVMKGWGRHGERKVAFLLLGMNRAKVSG